MTMLREFYHQANPVILEPIMRVGVEGPEEFQGAMMGGAREVMMGSVVAAAERRE